MARLNGRMYRTANLPAADTDPFVAKKEAVKFTNTFNQMKKMRRLAATARPAHSVPIGTRSVPGCMSTRSVGKISYAHVSPYADRSSRSAWECRSGRSASGLRTCKTCATQSQLGRGASRATLPRGAWARSATHTSALTLIVPHAPRGNAAQDAPRPGCAPERPAQLSPNRDAQRPGMHVHAEWARSATHTSALTLIVPHAPRGNAAQDAPRPGCAPVRPAQLSPNWDEERPGRRYHAGAWERSSRITGMSRFHMQGPRPGTLR